MRLTPHEVEVIVNTAQRQFGEKVTVILFGSRLDDRLRGGDIDLLVEVPNCIEHKARAAAHFCAALQMQLGDQKIDVLIGDAQSSSSIHRTAQHHGKVLFGPCSM